MPQLPSGRHVGLSADPVLDLARKGNFQLTIGVIMGITCPDDLDPLINVVYFRTVEGTTGRGEPYVSGLMLSQIGTADCDWSAEDLSAFRAWLELDSSRKWKRGVYDELQEIVRTVAPPIPDNLKGIFDPDD